MAWLLIDNSNTRTKLALGDRFGLQTWRGVMPTAEINTVSLKILTQDRQFSGVIMASVVPEKAEALLTFFQDRAQIHRLTSASPLGYGFDLDHPDQIGADRLANVAALKAKHGFPGIAVDFGTAVTFSVLSAEGNFSGGVIAPGMFAMTDYLASRTAQLPKIKPVEPVVAIGKTTVEALQAGAVIGQRGMIREILRELANETGGKTKVVATGGGAEFAARSLVEIDAVDPDLTLEGLRIVASRVFKSG